MIMLLMRLWIAVWMAFGFSVVASAGEIEDTATELTVLMVGKADPTRIEYEIADAKTRVHRRYVDDKTTETVIVGKETVVVGTEEVLVSSLDEKGKIVEAFETWDITEVVNKTEERVKTPTDKAILARLDLKLASIKRSMELEK